MATIPRNCIDEKSPKRKVKSEDHSQVVSATLVAALGSDLAFASALALAFASAVAAGVAGAASCLNGQFSREQDPVRLKVKHTWFPVRPAGLGVLGRFGVSGVFLE